MLFGKKLRIQAKPVAPEARPLAIDLRVFARRHRKGVGGSELVKLVTAAHDAHIVLRSLQDAKLLLVALSDLDNQFRAAAPEARAADNETAKLGMAFLAQAIMAYTRVTHGTTALHKFDIGKLNTAQLETHRRVLDLRNNVFGHYLHAKPDAQGPWDNQFVIWFPDAPGVKVQLPYLSSNWRGDLVEAFFELLIQIIPIANDAVAASISALVEALPKFIEANQLPRTAVEALAFDLSIFPDNLIDTIIADRIPSAEHVFSPERGQVVPELPSKED